jgi:murein DD-endopeptidase MepM/ murein hydrolase activator NlpD
VILIDHGNGFQTLYAHLNSLFVRCGQSVLKGSTIAGAGTTGNSTGPHIHFEIRYLGGFVNPLNYLR